MKWVASLGLDLGGYNTANRSRSPSTPIQLFSLIALSISQPYR